MMVVTRVTRVRFEGLWLCSHPQSLPIPLCLVKDALLSLTGPSTAITHTGREEEGEMGSFMGEGEKEEEEEEGGEGGENLNGRNQNLSLETYPSNTTSPP